MANSGAKNGDLTLAQRRAVTALLTERTTRAAAAAAGVPERTLARWLTAPEFDAVLRAQEAQLFDAAGRALLATAMDAVAALRQIVTNDAVAPHVRARAAGDLLDRIFRLRELRSVESRLDVLEGVLDGQTTH